MNDWINDQMKEWVRELVGATVCFISTVTFYDGMTQKVIKITQFCKKPLKDNALAFCN